MRKLLYAAILGLVGAGIVHAAIIILVPRQGGQDLHSRLELLVAPDRFVPLDAALMERAGLQASDPKLRMAVCRFSIADAPVRLTASGTVPFWSVSIFDARGVNLYSINDRSADLGAMDMLVATPLQLIELRKLSPGDIASAVVFEQEMDEGFAVLRVLGIEDSWSELVDRFLASAACGPYVIPDGLDEALPAGEPAPQDGTATQ